MPADSARLIRAFDPISGVQGHGAGAEGAVQFLPSGIRDLVTKTLTTLCEG